MSGNGAIEAIAEKEEARALRMSERTPEAGKWQEKYCRRRAGSGEGLPGGAWVRGVLRKRGEWV